MMDRLKKSNNHFEKSQRSVLKYIYELFAHIIASNNVSTIHYSIILVICSLSNLALYNNAIWESFSSNVYRVNRRYFAHFLSITPFLIDIEQFTVIEVIVLIILTWEFIIILFFLIILYTKPEKSSQLIQIFSNIIFKFYLYVIKALFSSIILCPAYIIRVALNSKDAKFQTPFFYVMFIVSSIFYIITYIMGIILIILLHFSLPVTFIKNSKMSLVFSILDIIGKGSFLFIGAISLNKNLYTFIYCSLAIGYIALSTQTMYTDPAISNLDRVNSLLLAFVFIEPYFKLLSTGSFLSIYLLLSIFIIIFSIYSFADQFPSYRANDLLNNPLKVVNHIFSFLRILSAPTQTGKVYLKGYIYRNFNEFRKMDLVYDALQDKNSDKEFDLYISSLKNDDLFKLIILHCNNVFLQLISNLKNNNLIKIFYSWFLWEYLDKQKSILLLETINPNHLGINASIHYYYTKQLTEEQTMQHYRRMISNPIERKFIEYDKIEKKFNELLKTSSLSNYSFWNLLSQESPDSKMVYSTGIKLLNEIDDVTNTWNKLHSIFPYKIEASIKYSGFLLYALHNQRESELVLEKVKSSLQPALSLESAFYLNDLNSTETPLLEISTNRKEIGKIINANYSLSKELHYFNHELVGYNLSKILPSNLSKIQELINQWLLKVFSQDNQLEIYLPFIDKMGFLIPGVLINIKNNNFLNQSIYAKIFFSNLRNESEGFSALIDQDLNIISISTSALRILNLSPELLKLAKCNLSQILDNNYTINRLISSDNGLTSILNSFSYQFVESPLKDDIKYLTFKGEFKGEFVLKGVRIGEETTKENYYIIDSKIICNNKQYQHISSQNKIEKSHYSVQFENSMKVYTLIKEDDCKQKRTNSNFNIKNVEENACSETERNAINLNINPEEIKFLKNKDQDPSNTNKLSEINFSYENKNIKNASIKDDLNLEEKIQNDSRSFFSNLIFGTNGQNIYLQKIIDMLTPSQIQLINKTFDKNINTYKFNQGSFAELNNSEELLRIENELKIHENEHIKSKNKKSNIQSEVSNSVFLAKKRACDYNFILTYFFSVLFIIINVTLLCISTNIFYQITINPLNKIQQMSINSKIMANMFYSVFLLYPKYSNNANNSIIQTNDDIIGLEIKNLIDENLDLVKEFQENNFNSSSNDTVNPLTNGLKSIPMDIITLIKYIHSYIDRIMHTPPSLIEFHNLFPLITDTYYSLANVLGDKLSVSIEKSLSDTGYLYPIIYISIISNVLQTLVIIIFLYKIIRNIEKKFLILLYVPSNVYKDLSDSCQKFLSKTSLTFETNIAEDFGLGFNSKYNEINFTKSRKFKNPFISVTLILFGIIAILILFEIFPFIFLFLSQYFLVNQTNDVFLLDDMLDIYPTHFILNSYFTILMYNDSEKIFKKSINTALINEIDQQNIKIRNLENKLLQNSDFEEIITLLSGNMCKESYIANSKCSSLLLNGDKPSLYYSINFAFEETLLYYTKFIEYKISNETKQIIYNTLNNTSRALLRFFYLKSIEEIINSLTTFIKDSNNIFLKLLISTLIVFTLIFLGFIFITIPYLKNYILEINQLISLLPNEIIMKINKMQEFLKE